MTTIKKITAFLASGFMLLSVSAVSLSVFAAGSIELSVNSMVLTPGDTATFSVEANGFSGTFSVIPDDPAVCSVVVDKNWLDNDSATVTVKAKGEGSTAIIVQAVDKATVEEGTTSGIRKSVAVTVATSENLPDRQGETGAGEQKADAAELKEITVITGTKTVIKLEPEGYEYHVKVPYGATSMAVNAKVDDPYKTEITGADNISDGSKVTVSLVGPEGNKTDYIIYVEYEEQQAAEPVPDDRLDYPAVWIYAALAVALVFGFIIGLIIGSISGKRKQKRRQAKQAKQLDGGESSVLKQKEQVFAASEQDSFMTASHETVPLTPVGVEDSVIDLKEPVAAYTEQVQNAFDKVDQLVREDQKSDEEEPMAEAVADPPAEKVFEPEQSVSDVKNESDIAEVQQKTEESSDFETSVEVEQPSAEAEEPLAEAEQPPVKAEQPQVVQNASEQAYIPPFGAQPQPAQQTYRPPFATQSQQAAPQPVSQGSTQPAPQPQVQQVYYRTVPVQPQPVQQVVSQTAPQASVQQVYYRAVPVQAQPVQQVYYRTVPAQPQPVQQVYYRTAPVQTQSVQQAAPQQVYSAPFPQPVQQAVPQQQVYRAPFPAQQQPVQKAVPQQQVYRTPFPAQPQPVQQTVPQQVYRAPFPAQPQPAQQAVPQQVYRPPFMVQQASPSQPQPPVQPQYPVQQGYPSQR